VSVEVDQQVPGAAGSPSRCSGARSRQRSGSVGWRARRPPGRRSWRRRAGPRGRSRWPGSLRLGRDRTAPTLARCVGARARCRPDAGFLRRWTAATADPGRRALRECTGSPRWGTQFHAAARFSPHPGSQIKQRPRTERLGQLDAVARREICSARCSSRSRSGSAGRRSR
jgi:hypothetical protein